VQMGAIHGTEELAHELGALTADLPTLIALPILLNAYVFTSERDGPRSRGGAISPGVSHGMRQSRRVYGSRWTESTRRAHDPSGALVGPCG